MEPLIPRLCFDGGPWIGGHSIARWSPWVESLAGGLFGALVALAVLPNAVTVAAGMVGWLVMALPASAVSALVWALTGVWAWTPDPGFLHLLGGLVTGCMVADLTQAISSQPFLRRLALSGVIGGCAVLLLAGLPFLVGRMG